MSAALSAPTRFLVTAEWAGWIKFIKGIRPNNASPKPLAGPENSRTFISPNTSGQSVWCVIGFFDRLLWGSEGQD